MGLTFFKILQMIFLPDKVRISVLAFLFFVVPTVHADSPPAPENRPVVAIEAVDILWDRAEKARESGAEEKAAELFVRLNDLYPENVKGEEALWNAAQIYKQLAEISDKPQWERARNLFRKFPVNYPNSPHAPEAYLELGKTNLKMRFLREALIYINVFQDKYPDSPLKDEGKYWEAMTLVEVGKVKEAEEIYRKLIASSNREISNKSTFALYDLYLLVGNYQAGLATIKTIVDRFPAHSPENLEIIKRQGLCMVHLPGDKNIDGGRKLLYYYLNVVEDLDPRQNVIFELAESYHRAGDEHTAQRLYKELLDEKNLEERVAVLSRFRQAQYLDDPGRKLEKWEKKKDITDPAGDAPYKAVLENYRSEPIAQDARQGLLARYMARKDYELAFELGKKFIKVNSSDQGAEAVYGSLGRILILRIEQLLTDKEYSKVYDLYRAEHEYISEYQDGRLLFLVGQALEGLYLYDQASVIYYRALKKELSPVDRTKLYFRRAEVYLANKDQAAAELLLKYLRGEYVDQAELAEVDFLSGRLRELQNRPEEALEFYGQAVKISKDAQKRNEYALRQLSLLIDRHQIDQAATVLAKYRQKNWLGGAELQEISARLGEIYLKNNDMLLAEEIYAAALTPELPEAGERPQLMHLRLGEIYSKAGRFKEAREHFDKASSGENEMWRKVAVERIKQQEITQSVKSVKKLLSDK